MNTADMRLSRLLAAHLSANRDGLHSVADVARSLMGLLGGMDRRRRDVAAAVAGNHFRLVYQPVVRLADRSVLHHEALLRLDAEASGGGAADTQDFLHLIEALGLSEMLDLAVLSQAQAALDGHAAAVVAVNLCGPSLQSAAFRQAFLARLNHAERLIIEITETAEITDTIAAAETLCALRERGVRVCLDDFGAGHSGFRYLRELPIDFVKIDGSYVHEATAGKREREVVNGMCELARAAGAGVIAEQIETEAEAKLMAELGVQYGQGWLFGHPTARPA